MTFDENTLRSVIEEVLKEMGEVSGTAAAPAAAPVAAAAGKLTITENGEARKGTAADEVVIGLAPAFGTKQVKTIIDLPHDKVLREIIAGIEEEGLKWRIIKVYHTSDVSFIAHVAAEYSGSGIGIGIQPLVGFHYGARNFTKMTKVVRFSMVCTLVLGLILTALYFLFTEPVISIFMTSGSSGSAADVITQQNYAVKMLRALMVSGPFLGIIFVNNLSLIHI